MSRPTHRLKATGEMVFAAGYPAEALEVASDAAWVAFARAERWAAIRAKRDALLARTDATQCTDRPVTLQLVWRPYRQALRDMTAQGGDPDAVTWPTPPAGSG